MNDHINAARARELLDEAGRLGSAARAGASWPHITCLLGIGGVSTMFIVSLYLVTRLDQRLIWFPMGAMAVWLAILIATMAVFNRASKAGFGRRWLQTIGAWSVTWLIAIMGGTVWWPGELWFAIAAGVAVTVVTAGGAWWEARR